MIHYIEFQILDTGDSIKLNNHGYVPQRNEIVFINDKKYKVINVISSFKSDANSCWLEGINIQVETQG